MSLNCGIVGLPNVGKSTIFSAMTSVHADAANYPFCTIEPNIGIVNIPDPRLGNIDRIVGPKKVVPAVVEFVDIAGLVKGASGGEGLGNQFLANIRESGAVIHIVRCFEDSDVAHVYEDVDPGRDIDIINIELALSDLQTVEKRLDNIEKHIRSKDRDIARQAKDSQPVLERLRECLLAGRAARSLEFSGDEKELIKDLFLITMKKVLYVCNIDENDISDGNNYTRQVREIAGNEGAEVVDVCGKLEAEIATLESEEDRLEFMESAGIRESGLSRLIKAGYRLLGLNTFFTTDGPEVRAWTFRQGTRAPSAASIIHTDFEKGFIRAEVCSYEDLILAGSELKVRENGRMRIEGKDYIVQDGDIVHFRFNV